ncbi:two-component system response regulator [Planctomycetales bacterium]|nr:two-component system response regulator [Planctomycetales bacterium]
MPEKTILVVDDNVLQLKLTGQLLSPDYKTVLVSSGRQALQFLQSHRPDLILLDVAMPEMSGIETLEEIQKIPHNVNIPVIFFTAMDDDSNEFLGLKKGAVDYITKPIIPELLLLRVQYQLELYDHRYRLEQLIKERTDQLNKLKKVTIHSLANITEYRDTDTGNHIKRTCLYVQVLGTAALDSSRFAGKIDEKAVESMVTAAPLHDVGKVGIPDNILNKPGKLTDEEFTIMKQHVVIGEKALVTAVQELGFESFLDTACDMATSHHERYDGRGYIKGLAGDNVPLSARIMSIADVYDALCAKRVYKDPMPHEKACNIIIEGQGTQFDPDLTELFKQKHEAFAEINQQYNDE